MLYCEQLTWVGGDRACGGGWGWTVGCPSRDLCLAAGQLMIYEKEDHDVHDSTGTQVIICDTKEILHYMMSLF